MPFAFRTFLLASAIATSAGLAQAATAPITEADVVAAENAWGDGIVQIGKLYSDGGDYKAYARQMIADMYGYGEGTVLFKPTKAAEDEFRETPDQALSYFVTGDEKEDHGFALQPWSKVRFDNKGIAIDGDSATAMGNYYFTEAKTGKEVKVDFTMGFRRAKDGTLDIFLHHSSLPFEPAHRVG